MTPEERLQSLQEWAEGQKYVRPGEGGTLGFGVRNMQAMVYGGPVHYVHHQYDAPIAPPSYETATRQDSAGSGKEGKTANPVKRWLKKRKESKRSVTEPNAGDQLPDYQSLPHET